MAKSADFEDITIEKVDKTSTLNKEKIPLSGILEEKTEKVENNSTLNAVFKVNYTVQLLCSQSVSNNC